MMQVRRYRRYYRDNWRTPIILFLLLGALFGWLVL